MTNVPAIHAEGDTALFAEGVYTTVFAEGGSALFALGERERESCIFWANAPAIVMGYAHHKNKNTIIWAFH